MPTSLSNEIPPLIKKTNKMHLCHKRKKKKKKRKKKKRNASSKAKQTYSVELGGTRAVCEVTCLWSHSQYVAQLQPELTQMSSYHTRVPAYKLHREEKS